MTLFSVSKRMFLNLSMNFCCAASRNYSRKLKKAPVSKIVLHKDVIKKNRLQDQDPVQHEGAIEDMPDLCHANPYEKPLPKCIICEHNVPLDYKNVRLLSQFVSSHTGLIYDRQVTGLCVYMHTRISNLIKRARNAGLMAHHYKDPAYIKDPKLFDPFRRKW